MAVCSQTSVGWMRSRSRATPFVAISPSPALQSKFFLTANQSPCFGRSNSNSIFGSQDAATDAMVLHTLPRRDQLTGQRVLEARVANQGTALAEPIDLALQAYERASTLQFGSVEWVGGVKLIGTAYDPESPNRNPTIRVFENDLLVAEGRCRRWSPKRQVKDSLSWLHFDVHLPLEFADGRVHVLQVKDESNHELEGSPVSIQAFNDGLRQDLQQNSSTNDEARGTWFDRLLPMSIPFEAYPQWEHRFPRQCRPVESLQPVRVVLIGLDNIGDALQRLEKQNYEAWSAVAIASPDGVSFDWDDLKEALFADAAEHPIAVFVSTQTVLHCDALASLVSPLLDDHEALVSYSDIEVIDADAKPQPLFFGAFDYERMIEQGYASWFFAVNVSKIVIPAGERSGSLTRLFLSLFDQSIIRAREQVIHVPGALARIAPDNLAAATQALKSATANHLRKRGVRAQVEGCDGSILPAVRIRRKRANNQVVSIVIPTRDRVDLLRNCIKSIQSRTKDAEWELIIVDNNLTSEEARDYLQSCKQHGAQIVSVPGPFNYSHLNNRGVDCARGEFVCLLNNDTEIFDPDWMNELLSRIVEPDVGAVAPVLLWRNKMIQHGGIVLGPHFSASNAFNDCMDGDGGYGDLLRVSHECSAVTAACMLVRRKDYHAISGFDELAFPILFNDVDFCLRLRAIGKRIILTPHTKLFHHEAASRGNDHSPDQAGRFKRELRELRNRWGAALADDPYYSPFLNLDHYPFSALAWPPRPATPRGNQHCQTARLPRKE